jgi:hypothetical protein
MYFRMAVPWRLLLLPMVAAMVVVTRALPLESQSNDIQVG